MSDNNSMNDMLQLIFRTLETGDTATVDEYLYQLSVAELCKVQQYCSYLMERSMALYDKHHAIQQALLKARHTSITQEPVSI